MASYFVYGALGTGKGVFLAKKMQQYLARGSRVATNVELFPEVLCPNTSASISRVPSIFRVEDLKQLGRGCPEDEKKELGGLFLDEGAMWLNSRDWNNKERKDLIALFIMIRKLGWDIYIAIQDVETTDKQALGALGALGENFICCTRLDHFRIPLLTPIYEFYHFCKSRGKNQNANFLPHMNAASYRKGKSKQGNKPYYVERYRPKDMFGSYDTNQIFTIDQEYVDGMLLDMRASYSYLSGKTLIAYADERERLKNPDKINASLVTSKNKRPYFKMFLFAMCLYPIYASASYLLGESGVQEVISPATTLVSSKTVQTKAVVNSLPDYLVGSYITGHVLIRDDLGNFTYDYALHDRYDRSFDYSFYALELTPSSSCLAWLKTIDGLSYKLTCKLSNSIPSTSDDNSLLGDFSFADVATKTLSNIN